MQKNIFVRLLFAALPLMFGFCFQSCAKHRCQGGCNDYILSEEIGDTIMNLESCNSDFDQDTVESFPNYSENSYRHEYNHNYAYQFNYKKQLNGRAFDSDAYLHRRYDNTDNFSAGISSYQGTSTGPGPNGGYPGTPRGVYKTNYYPQ